MKTPKRFPQQRKLGRLTPCFNQIKNYSNKKKNYIPVDWSGCKSPFYDGKSIALPNYLFDNTFLDECYKSWGQDYTNRINSELTGGENKVIRG